MLTVKSDSINIDAVLKVIILLGYALFFYTIIKTGKVQLYVNPRIVPYVKLGIVIMVIISLFFIRDIIKPNRKVNLIPSLFFLVPLFMAFSIPAKAMDSTSMAFGDIKITQHQNKSTDNASQDTTGSNSNGEDNTEIVNASNSTDTSQNSDTSGSAPADPDQMDKGLKMQGGTVVVSDNNFVQWLQEIYDNMGKYEGKKIQVVGFVFKSKDFRQDEFVPARLMMVCCTADLQPVGFLCRYSKAPELKHDTWIKVTGTIEIVDYKGQKTPVIAAEKAESAVKPKNEYVYPY